MGDGSDNISNEGERKILFFNIVFVEQGDKSILQKYFLIKAIERIQALQYKIGPFNAEITMSVVESCSLPRF